MRWRLPDGQALAVFALQAGFVIPRLMREAALGSDSHSLGMEASAAGRRDRPVPHRPM